MRCRLLARGQIGSQALGLCQSLGDQNLVQSVGSDQDKTVVPCFLAAACCAGPARPNGEWISKRVAHKVSGHPASLHALVQADAEILALLARTLGVAQVDFW